MKTSISNYSLWIATVMLLIIVSFGTYEYYYNMPNWFSDPPVSFEVIRQQAEGSQRFWIPVQLLFFVSFIIALVTNWRLPKVRNFLVYAGITYLLVLVATAAYFVKEVLAFMDMPIDAPKTDELIGRVTLWYRTTIIRNILQFLSLVFIVMANYKKFNRGNESRKIGTAN